MIKKLFKYIYLKIKGIDIDYKSSINIRAIKKLNSYNSIYIRNSNLNIKEIKQNCFIENTFCYGNIIIDRFVSISGPGTVLHSVAGKISVGAFSSIGQNVSINEFNHRINYPTTYAVNFHLYSKDFKDDVTTKGDINIEEDVWIGSNSCILSGVRLGRGCIIAAGSVVTKDVAPYSIVGGVPAKLIRMRFTPDVIEFLENSKWWTWSREKLLENKHFFNTEL